MRISDWSSDVCSSDLVHNKLQAATALLPQEVQRQGVTVAQSAASFLLITAIYSEDGTHTANDLSDYIVSQIQDPVSRINGVGELQIFGTQYSMRIWVDPLKLRSYNLTIADVSTAVSAQNAQVSAGQIGQLPASKEQQIGRAHV